MTTLDIADLAPGRPTQHEHDAALIARVQRVTREATICECQAWLREAADVMVRMAEKAPPVEKVMLLGADSYRFSATMLELMKAPP